MAASRAARRAAVNTDRSGSTIAFSEDSEATQPGTGGVDGSGIPNGFHVMPDNTIMSDDAHIYGDGYYVV